MVITYKQYLLETIDNVHDAYYYALHHKTRVYDYEPIIKKDPFYAYRYALDVIEGPWPEAEPFIKQDPFYAVEYAKNVLFRRWPEAEPYIITHPEEAARYARDLVQDRWPEAESSMIKNGPYWNYVYLDFLGKKHYSDKEKLQWLKNEGVTKTLFSILNYLGMNTQTQEYIIKRRPDLINKILRLKYKLKQKYAHELNLGKIDI